MHPRRERGKEKELKQKQRRKEWNFVAKSFYSKLNRNLCLPNYHRSVRKNFQLVRHVPENCYLFAFFASSRSRPRNVFVTNTHTYIHKQSLQAQVYQEQALEMDPLLRLDSL